MKLPTRATLAPATALLLLLSSCNYLGPIGAVVGRAMPKYVDAQYKGLAGHTAVVMVWVERGRAALISSGVRTT